MSKNGRPRVFEKPEDLLKAWNEYKKYKDEEANKWLQVNYVGRDGDRVTDKPTMPYTIDGFITWYYNKYKRFIHQYFEGKEKEYEGFLGIVTHIKAERNDNIKTGTLLGHFNASMGNRIVGLADKQETEIKGQLNIPPLPDIGER